MAIVGPCVSWTKLGFPYEALDNGFRWCADPVALQRWLHAATRRATAGARPASSSVRRNARAFEPPPVGGPELSGLDPSLGTELGGVLLAGDQIGRMTRVAVNKAMRHGVEDTGAAHWHWDVQGGRARTIASPASTPPSSVPRDGSRPESSGPPTGGGSNALAFRRTDELAGRAPAVARRGGGMQPTLKRTGSAHQRKPLSRASYGSELCPADAWPNYGHSARARWGRAHTCWSSRRPGFSVKVVD